MSTTQIGLGPKLRRLSCFFLLGAFTILCSTGARAADSTDERGATSQKNARRQDSGTNSKSSGAPIFSPIPKTSSFSITNPIIMITPATLDFGFVAPGKTATNTFMVENVGHGKLSGTASAAPPFKIDSGGSYTLKEKEVQIVTVVYSPSRQRVDTAPVTFTAGGTSVKATAVGKRLSSRE